MKSLSSYKISQHNGFLCENPIKRLPDAYLPWINLVRRCEDHINHRCLQEKIHELPLISSQYLNSFEELFLAHLVLSILASGYVWENGESNNPKAIPKQVALPLCTISQQLGLKPIISHPSFCLINYQKIYPSRPLNIDNMKLLFYPHGGQDCHWFILTAAQIELDFAHHALPHILSLVEATKNNDEQACQSSLRGITSALQIMKTSLSRMHEHCRPDVFYNDVRPFLAGWPEGMVYEGVSEAPMKLAGGSAAQSAPLHCVDAVLAVNHSERVRAFFVEMRQYMLPEHRQFIYDLEKETQILAMIKYSSVAEEYKRTLDALESFRSYHIQIVAKYIIIPSKRKSNCSRTYESLSSKGTGGTELIPFLREVRQASQNAKKDIA